MTNDECHRRTTRNIVALFVMINEANYNTCIMLRVGRAGFRALCVYAINHSFEKITAAPLERGKKPNFVGNYLKAPQINLCTVGSLFLSTHY